MKEVIGIQYLRAIAALAVVVFHSLLHVYPPAGKTPFEVSLFAGGVDLFFVISGFIIWSSTQGRSLSPLVWWKSRLIRIVPLYWLTLLASLGLSWLYGQPSPAWSEIVRAFFFVPTFDSRTGELAPFFVPGWTLNYEFFFYALMMVALLFRSSAVRLGGLIAVLGALVVMRKVADPASAIQMAYSSPLTFEFVGGIVVAIAYRRLRSSERLLQRDWIFGAGALALAIGMLFAVSPRLYESAPRALYFGLPAVLIVFGVACLERRLQRRRVTWLKRLGDASYSLYLGHEFVLYATLGAMAAILPAHPALGIAVGVCVCALFGFGIHKIVETPLLSAIRGSSGAAGHVKMPARLAEARS